MEENSHTPLILLVEDDDSLRDLYAEVLTRAGYEVVKAADAETALALLAARRCQLVVTDYALPNKSGVELIREIQARHTALPTLLMSVDSHIPHLAQRAGADGYFRKGETIARFLGCVGELLGKE